jgi:hypothetical protein
MMNSVEEKSELKHQQWRPALKCSFEQIDEVFDGCMDEALALLSEQAVDDYLDGASLICMIGRGVEPVLVFLEEIPQIANRTGEEYRHYKTLNSDEVRDMKW